jgi:hypothetical protein
MPEKMDNRNKNIRIPENSQAAEKINNRMIK